jgi:hypothetical protein
MKTVLEARRQKLLGELARVNRQIGQTKVWLARIETRITLVKQARDKAA